MPHTDPPPAPPLPIPISQISRKIDRYMLFDINTISWLRQAHNILGVLLGSLPQIPQQNVFLGLPLELQPEEARLLVDQRLAFVVDDLEWHTRDLATKDAVQVEAIRADMFRQGVEVAKGWREGKQGRTQKALEKIRDKGKLSKKKDSNARSAPETEDSTYEETLFGEPLTKETTVTPSIASSHPDDPELNPWSITPTTSYPTLTKPTQYSPPILPKVNPSSYALFAHLHRLGYFMSPGIRFGCQFSVYPGDPLRFHSHFLAMSYEWNEDIDLLDLIGGGRLGTGVKKGWLIGGLEEEGKTDQESPATSKVRTFCIEWGAM